MLVHYAILFCFSASSLAKPLQTRTLQVHEARQAVPHGYASSGPASPDTVMNLRIALVQNNISGLIDALYDVSTPSSVNYGQHLTQAEIEAFVAPKPEVADAVNSWLAENDLNSTTISPAGDWLQVAIPISKANDLLEADYTVFKSTVTGSTAVRTLSYSIPADLAGYIDLIHPTITFPSPYEPKSPTTRVSGSVIAVDASDACVNVEGSGMVPACLQQLYNIPTTPATIFSNHLAVAEYEGQWVSPSDLQLFLQYFRPDINPETSYTILSVDGGINNGSDPGAEANLDTQYAIGLATDVPVTFLTVGGDDFLTGLLDAAHALLADDNPPHVVSTSYSEDEYLVSPLFANNLCNVYAQLGARGVSLFTSSGDGGVAGHRFNNCTTFVPTFPPGCPFITSVGATYMIPEVAVDFSGGGFSNYFSRPPYQAFAAANYFLHLGLNNTGLYNRTGRGYPDVSAYGVDFQIVYNHSVVEVSGTSCSAPTFASVIALLNDRLLAVGRPVLGFLNPWLYSIGASALTDIISGNNFACGPDKNVGFEATEGWDPVSGLGTPKFDRLLAAVGL